MAKVRVLGNEQVCAAARAGVDCGDACNRHLKGVLYTEEMIALFRYQKRLPKPHKQVAGGKAKRVDFSHRPSRQKTTSYLFPGCLT